ncbi:MULTISPECIES: hypothetical protein [unclassified Thiocapsa]|uniref:hypothetical protein n=1 Tax=unclassified Thiocapsa TaxID=2641286 RepID=UPI0035B40A5F
MNDGVRRTLTVLVAVGIMIGFMVLSWSWMAPAIAVDGETRFFLWEEGSGTALQVKLAFFGAILVAAPIYLLLLRLPWLRTPSVSDAASPALRIPPFLWLGIGLVMTVAVIQLPLPGLPDPGGGRTDAPPLDWVRLFLLTVLLPTWVAVVLFAVAVGPRAAPAATGVRLPCRHPL